MKETKKMSNESVINVSVDGAGNPVVFSPIEETARREDIIALYTKAIAHMDVLQKEAFAAGKYKPGLHFDTNDCKPFSIPFKVLSENGASFDVEFIEKDYDVLNILFAQLFLKEKRKQARRK